MSETRFEKIRKAEIERYESGEYNFRLYKSSDPIPVGTIMSGLYSVDIIVVYIENDSTIYVYRTDELEEIDVRQTINGITFSSNNPRLGFSTEGYSFEDAKGVYESLISITEDMGRQR